MGNVFEPPAEIVVIGYTYRKPNDAGAVQLVFTSRQAAERWLDEKLNIEVDRSIEKLMCFELVTANGRPCDWANLEVEMPTSARFKPGQGG